MLNNNNVNFRLLKTIYVHWLVCYLNKLQNAMIKITVYNLLKIYIYIYTVTVQDKITALYYKIHIYETPHHSQLVSLATARCTNSNSYYECHDRETLRYNTCSHHVLRRPNFTLPKAPQAIWQGTKRQQTAWNWNGVTFCSTLLHTSNEPWQLTQSVHNVTNSKSWNCLFFGLCPLSHAYK